MYINRRYGKLSILRRHDRALFAGGLLLLQIRQAGSAQIIL